MFIALGKLGKFNTCQRALPFSLKFISKCTSPFLTTSLGCIPINIFQLSNRWFCSIPLSLIWRGRLRHFNCSAMRQSSAARAQGSKVSSLHSSLLPDPLVGSGWFLLVRHVSFPENAGPIQIRIKSSCISLWLNSPAVETLFSIKSGESASQRSEKCWPCDSWLRLLHSTWAMLTVTCYPCLQHHIKP